MNESRFRCTACGQCCYGLLPLTIKDAMVFADLFPLALLGETIGPAHKSYDLAVRLGTLIEIQGRGRVALILTPIAYLPPDMACPALAPDNLCSIHDQKPQRCRTMPFYPFREECEQMEFLVPRKGWRCDVSEDAPVVYKNNEIIDRVDFDSERAELLEQAAQLRAYAAFMLKQGGGAFIKQVEIAARKPLGGRFILNFSPLLRLQRDADLVAFAAKQRPVLLSFAEQTAANATHAPYHAYYTKTAQELAWFVQ